MREHQRHRSQHTVEIGGVERTPLLHDLDAELSPSLASEAVHVLDCERSRVTFGYAFHGFLVRHVGLLLVSSRNPLLFLRSNGSSYSSRYKTSFWIHVRTISRHWPWVRSVQCFCTTFQAARGPLPPPLSVYRWPFGIPVSISVSTALSVTADTLPQVSGGFHGSTVCTSSPLGYSSVALPILTPTSLNQVAMRDGGAMFTLALSRRT